MLRVWCPGQLCVAGRWVGEPVCAMSCLASPHIIFGALPLLVPIWGEVWGGYRPLALNPLVYVILSVLVPLGLTACWCRLSLTLGPLARWVTTPHVYGVAVRLFKIVLLPFAASAVYPLHVCLARASWLALRALVAARRNALMFRNPWLEVLPSTTASVVLTGIEVLNCITASVCSYGAVTVVGLSDSAELLEICLAVASWLLR